MNNAAPTSNPMEIPEFFLEALHLGFPCGVAGRW